MKDFILGVLLTGVAALGYHIWKGPEVIIIKVPFPVPIHISTTMIELPPVVD
jgi:hypothetical protein